ncbi:MAG TPA: biotin transporter BioY [Acidobacteriaceae bacterium]|nr:biotin transporter BioY [Acidobacteriaceae bacterium]
MQEVGFKQHGLHWLSAPYVAWNTVLRVIASTALVAICAHISVPLGFTPVPITMQTFAVLLLGLLFGPGAAFASLSLYLLEGALGLPVFSPHGVGAIAQLLGPTGGYLLSYPFAAALTSVLYRRWGQSSLSALGGAGLASLIILGAGSVWLATLTHANFSAVLAQSMVPFLPGEAVKVVAASGCARVLGTFGRDPRQQTL